MPSKTYNILAAGKPILFIGDVKSEVALMIKEYQVGFVFAPDNQIGIKNFLSNLSIDKKQELREMGERARKLAEDVYSEQVIIKKYSKLFS